MRLLLVAPLLGGRGLVPDVFETLGPILADRGHDVAMTSDDPRAPTRVLRMAAATTRHRRRVDAVVVHLYSGRALVAEEAVARLAGRRPLVGHLSGGGFPAFAERHPRWVPRVLDRFDHLTAPSAHLARWAATVTATPVRVIPNPLDLGDYPFRERSPAAPRLLWLRAYHPIYAPEVAVRVLDGLRRTHPAARLTMVGADKGERATVTALVRDLDLGDHVEVGGFADAGAKRRLFADHDVFLNTSRVDNRPVSVVEAAACGLCVVSTDVGGVPDLVRDGESALLVPPDDPTAMAGAVERILADPGLASRLSAAGRQVAEAGTPERVGAAWDEVLAEVAGLS